MVNGCLAFFSWFKNSIIPTLWVCTVKFCRSGELFLIWFFVYILHLNSEPFPVTKYLKIKVFITESTTLQNHFLGAPEMTLWLSTFTAFPEDPGSAPCAQIRLFDKLTPALGDLSPPSVLDRQLHSHAHTHSHKI